MKIAIFLSVGSFNHFISQGLVKMGPILVGMKLDLPLLLLFMAQIRSSLTSWGTLVVEIPSVKDGPNSRPIETVGMGMGFLNHQQ